MLVSALEQWRGVLAAQRLTPLERTFAAQNRHALMYKAFEVWRSRTTVFTSYTVIVISFTKNIHSRFLQCDSMLRS